MTSNAEQDVVEKLKSSSTSEIYNTLLKIRKSYVRNRDKMKKLQKYHVIKLIIPLMEHPKFCNISLSIIADGCLELCFVNDVIKCDGLKALMRIMKSGVNDDVQNRACRALGNIAKFEIGFKAVHLMKPLSIVIKFLCETTDFNSQQTVVRTLMILGKSSKARQQIVKEYGLIYIAKLLRSSNASVLICSIKALAALTHNCSSSAANQLLELDFHKVLVELSSHSENSVRNCALISLKNLSSPEDSRFKLVKAGAVNIFIEALSSCKSLEMSRYAALTLCRLSDKFNYWDGTDKSTGLKALLTVLQNNHLQDIHIPVLAALIPLSYDLENTEMLLNLNVLEILFEILVSFIKKHECKGMHKFIEYHIACADFCALNGKLTIQDEIRELSDSRQWFDIDVNKENKKFDCFEIKTSVSPEKSPNVSPRKSMHKWDASFYGTSSVTSDYSGSCSPSGTCSPTLKYPVSPECNYDADVGSPSTGQTSSGIWSPASLADESFPSNMNCWSPVVSTHSSSPIQESKYFEYEENEDIEKDDFFSNKEFNTTFSNVDTQENKLFKMSVWINSSCLKSGTVEEIESTSKLIDETDSCDNSDMIPSKKLKTESSIADNQLYLKHKTANKINIKEVNSSTCSKIEDSTNYCDLSRKDNTASSVCSGNNECVKKRTNSASDISDELIFLDDYEQISDLKMLHLQIDQQTIDRFVIIFILQISYHIKKKTNSLLAEKSFFSAIIDYACLIHNPSAKTRLLLLNLVKNRYSLERLISNGFFCELADKMNYFGSSPCNSHLKTYNWYLSLMQFVKEEIKSSFAIGALLHILIKSDKMRQLNALCASKLVTDKLSLHKILTEGNGLSLLLKFLSDPDEKIKIRATMALLKMYQTFTLKEEEEPRRISEKRIKLLTIPCCLGGTCKMETSTKCFYKESFLDVTFVGSGGAKILANRDKICENSDYFRALLQGNFEESNKKLIALPDMAAENLSAIFHFLHGCGNGSCCPYINRIPFSVLLELLSDCERLLLTNIKIFVEDRLYHNDSSPSHIAKTYKQSKLHNSLPLAEKILQRAMEKDTKQKRQAWIFFKELLDVGSSVNIYEDIEALFKSGMSSFYYD